MEPTEKFEKCRQLVVRNMDISENVGKYDNVGVVCIFGAVALLPFWGHPDPLFNILQAMAYTPIFAISMWRYNKVKEYNKNEKMLSELLKV